MRFDYSIIRYQPDPVAEEFVNVGVIVTNGHECAVVRHLQRSRVSHLRNGVAYLGAAERALERIEAAAAEFDRSKGTLDIPDLRLAPWLEHLAGTERSVVYVTPPAPVVGESAETVAHELEAEYILHFARRSGETRSTAKASLRTSLRSSLLRINLTESVELVAGNRQRHMIDFVVRNGAVRQLSHAWSFRTRNANDRETEVQAWAWVIGQLKEVGGFVHLDNDDVPVSPDVDVEVYVVPPRQAAPDYDRALATFDSLNVGIAEQPENIAERALELIGTH